ncbi:MAG: chorismate-binding protein [Solirubrobacteraceae bacterium]
MKIGRLNEELQHIILENKKFCLFKLPFQKKINLYAENSLNHSEKGFVINNFENTKKHYIYPEVKLTFSPSEYDKDNPIDLKKINNQRKETYSTYLLKIHYLQTIEKAISLLNNQLTKVVIGRKIKWQNNSFNELNHFIKLCDNFSSFSYLIYIPNTLCWIGSTPELLLKYKNKKLTTVSLAGTKKKSEEWSEKEFEEQKIVTKYIENLAIQNNIITKISPTKTFLINNKFDHLKTIINSLGSINFNKALNFLNKLHPTPAICGLPKEEAIEIIKKLEKEDRSFYTGYIGIQEKDNLELYVNIRCASVYNDFLDVYVGSGITKKSIPTKEWEETELKSKTIIFD